MKSSIFENVVNYCIFIITSSGTSHEGEGGSHDLFFFGGGAVQRGISCGQYSIKEDYRKLIAN